MVMQACRKCGAAIDPAARGKGLFCSRACWRAYEADGKPVVTCAGCGKVFRPAAYKVRRRRTSFCSAACYRAHTDAVPVRAALADRFWAKVRKADGGGCWEWQGARDVNGYGRISAGRRGKNPLLVTRVSYELEYGPIPDGQYVLHRCDNPPCVRPDHLFLGDQAVNMADCSEKGRRPRGERSVLSRLTEAQVREMRRRYDGSRGALARLSQEFGVAWQTVADVVHRRTWAHLED